MTPDAIPFCDRFERINPLELCSQFHLPLQIADRCLYLRTVPIFISNGMSKEHVLLTSAGIHLQVAVSAVKGNWLCWLPAGLFSHRIGQAAIR
ncbi:hypothetical protein B6J54_19595 [Klebsiella quasipneumoniae]|nr:hypothetical protein DA795_22835 [Klebsiella pneumoniae]PCE34624.1 hypothetical protein CI706_25675 [Klebsiella pneumoniae subsp. pneumoniae]PLD17226.1 hypothetical protein B6I49_24185 [Klebsiella quasipneumoniae]PLI83719.1 hypothetical protein B6J54_19595 [Klebsiella quasipneumoniae]